MQVSAQISENAAVFAAGDKVAGHYVLDDPYKPYMHPLRTPAGHPVTVAMPGDHRHHKGLMYALKCEDVNFWEEEPGTGHCGMQEIRSTANAEGGIVQEILWREEGGGLQTYNEQRRITCELSEDSKRFEWTWSTRRESLRDHKLVKSPWSLADGSGRKINYHGLGIRLPWMWRFGNDNFNGVEQDGEPVKAEEAHGTTGSQIGWWGLIDGYWSPPKAAVTLRQEHGFGWFVLKGDFAYIAAGPSNLEEIEIRAGDVFEEIYHLTVEDRNRSVETNN